MATPRAQLMSAFSIEVVVAPGGNVFMTDIASWIAEAATTLGHRAHVVADGSLPGDGSAEISFVVAPHELFELSARPMRERLAAAARCIPVATEQPGTSWFERSVDWCRLAPFALDINPSAVSAMRARGVDARALRLGAVPSMDRSRPADPRTRDVVVLAGLTDHRERRLAGLAPTLWPHRSELRLFPADRPVTADSASRAGGAVFGADKYELLADTRILLNLHRDETTTYFEWARVVEAMANGCVVVSEPAEAIEPLVDGEHLVMTEDPATAIEELLADPARLDRIGAAGWTAVHGELALAASLAPALDAAGAALSSRTASSVAAGRRRSFRPALRRPGFAAFRPHRELRRRLLDAVVAERTLRRRIDELRCEHRHGTADSVQVIDSPAWATARPDVSAIVTLFDYADVVTEALDSLAASTDVDLEIVVVDDHSTDDGRAVVADWITRHPEQAIRLVGLDANGGLAAARNRAIEITRTDRVMILDADNLVRPPCLARLSAALDDHPDAAFAWSILEVFGDQTGLLSAHAWDPTRLLERNLIDAQVMLRRSTWTDLGGYRELPEMLPGWEDWDLWLRIVAGGGHGVLLPELLGRYRSARASMVSGPTRFDDVMLERFEALHPELVFPAR